MAVNLEFENKLWEIKLWGTDPEREFLEIARGKGRKLPGYLRGAYGMG